MRILIATIGSHGDVLPFIALGRELQRRGYDVRFYADKTFERLANEAALHFTPIATGAEYQEALQNPDVTHPIKGMRMVADATIEYTPMFYQAMCKDIDPGRTIVIGSTLVLAARLIREMHQVPTAIVHLAPSVLRTEYMTPRLSPLLHMPNAPRFLKRFIWHGVDKHFLDPLYTAPFNEIRNELGLKPIERIWQQWINDADVLVGMFPEWFAECQPDWPAALQLTGFPLDDHGKNEPLPEALNAFLQAGEAPIGFTAGTANATSHKFFAASVEACRISGRRGIMLTQNAAQLPADLPQNVLHVPYAPFKALLPRLAAFVHHGGIGSTSEALRAGVPQLIRPMAYDQFDNASRAVRLGVAREILPRRYRPKQVAKILQELINTADVRKNCQKIAGQLANEDGIARACDAVLTLH